MAEVQDLTAEGIELLIEALGESTGTLTQEGTDYAFSSAVALGDSREAQPGRTDVKRRTLLVLGDGVGVEPRANSQITFTGDTATWAVQESEPVAPGGTVEAWRLTLVDRVNRED